MKEGSTTRIDSDRFDEACHWFVTLREAPESKEQVAAWLDWCRSDPRNPVAFEEVRELWQATDFVRHARPLVIQQPPAMQPAAATERSEGRRSARRRNRLRFLAAAALVTLAAGVGWLMQGAVPSEEVQVSAFVTAPSEHRSISLSDGSRIELAGDSSIKATLRSSVREIELLRGEAYFRVAHDKARPFIVHTASVHVRAVGTSFDVRTSGDRVVVAVEEGMVVLEPRPEPANAVDSVLNLLRPEHAQKERAGALQPLSLRGGQEAAVGAAAQAVQLLPIEPTAVASWRAGRLRFAREPLSSVIASIRAATGRDIQIADPQLGELLFTGTVFSSRVEAWADGLSAIFPVRVLQDGAQLVIVPREGP